MMRRLITLLLLTVSLTAFADSIPKEFVVHTVDEGVWQNQNSYIYKTSGTRGAIVFVSSTCKNKEFTPRVSTDGNAFVEDNYVFAFSDVGLSLKVISNNICFIPGWYQRVK